MMGELTKKERRIGDLFLDLGLITEAQLKRAIALQKREECFLGEALIKIGAISRDKLYWVLADQFNLPYISNLSRELIDPDVVKFIPEEIARGYSILPVYSTDDELSVIIHDPTNMEILDSLKQMTGKKHLKIAISNRESINSVLDEFYGISRARPAKERGMDIWSDYFEKSQLTRCMEDVSGKEFLNFILLAAELEGTPSIHLGTESNELLVKFRIGDQLLPKFRGAPEWHTILLNQLKTLAGIHDGKTRLFVKSRFEYEVKGEKITYRLTIVKGFTGEKVILHPYKSIEELLTLRDLGMTNSQINLVINRAQILSGMVLITTPASDAIPRTINGLLANLNLKNANVVTFEHTIFFKNEHFLQIETKHFSEERLLNTLYEIASLDVDLLMVDLIKNTKILEEILSLAFRIPKIYGAMIQDSMIKAIETLFRVGEDPTFAFLNTNMILFQYPLSLLCPHCKQEIPPDAIPTFAGDLSREAPLYKPVGCERCNHTGYQKTVFVFEVLPVTHEVREFAFMDLPATEKARKIYDLVSPKLEDFVVEALEKGDLFWGDVRKILEGRGKGDGTS